MKPIFRTTAIVVMMALMSATAVFAQNTTGTGTNPGTTSPFHQVILTVNIPSSIPEGAKVSVQADWTVKYTTMTEPTKEQSFTVIPGTTVYKLTYYCPTDAEPSKIYFCGKVNTMNLYTYKESLIDKSSSTTYVTITASEWNTIGCMYSGGGGGTD